MNWGLGIDTGDTYTNSSIIDLDSGKVMVKAELTSVFDFPEASDEDVDRFVESIKRAIGYRNGLCVGTIPLLYHRSVLGDRSSLINTRSFNNTCSSEVTSGRSTKPQR
jgi:hypothetical protein